MNDQTTNTSAQITNEQANEPPLYISPTLKKLDAKHRPEPSPACETCPASVWFTTNDLLKCFCGRMHLIVWEGNEQPILKCDGRELAILALLEAQNG
ncbi:Protein TraH [uncultured bacterium]|nr:Protein TraH [uncultured bacterium]